MSPEASRPRRWPRVSPSIRLTVLILLASGWLSSAWAIEHGDVLLNGQRSIYRVAASDSSFVLLSGDQGHTLFGFGVGLQGEIYAGEIDAFVQYGTIYRVMEGSGSLAPVSVGGALRNVVDVEVAPDGYIIAADSGPFGGTGGVFRIDAASGEQETLFVATKDTNPTAVAVDGAGTIYFMTVAQNGSLAIYRHVAYGTEPQLVTSGGLLGGFYMAYANQSLFVSCNQAGSKIIRVDLASGAQDVVAEGDLLTYPYGIAIRSTGCVVVADIPFCPFFCPGRLLCIDPASGEQSIVVTYPGQQGGPYIIAALTDAVTRASRVTWGMVKSIYRN